MCGFRMAAAYLACRGGVPAPSPTPFSEARFAWLAGPYAHAARTRCQDVRRCADPGTAAAILGCRGGPLAGAPALPETACGGRVPTANARPLAQMFRAHTLRGVWQECGRVRTSREGHGFGCQRQLPTGERAGGDGCGAGEDRARLLDKATGRKYIRRKSRQVKRL